MNSRSGPQLPSPSNTPAMEALATRSFPKSRNLQHTCTDPEACFPKAPCSAIVDTWAFKRLPYHHLGVYVYTIELHGAFGFGTC